MRRALVLVSLAVSACQSSASTTASSAPPASQTAATGFAASPAPPAPAPASAPGVAAVLSAAPGTPVTVVGLYLGWKGPCMGSPPTRSAWMLADAEQKGAACLYVDGPAVPGVSPNAAGKNIRVRVTGVLRDEGGQKYIEAQKVERQ